MSNGSPTDAASSAGASTPRWELHDPTQKEKEKREPRERGGRRERGAEGEERGGQAQDNRTGQTQRDQDNKEANKRNKNRQAQPRTTIGDGGMGVEAKAWQFTSENDMKLFGAIFKKDQ